jgi:hypothetical protein
MQTDVYSPREIALAAGVSEEQVLAALRDPGGPVSVNGYVRHADAVRLGQALLTLGAGSPSARSPRSLFSIFSEFGRTGRTTTVPLALSSTLHLGLIAFAVFATFNLTPRAATIPLTIARPSRCAWFSGHAGPGGGVAATDSAESPAAKAMREARAISSPAAAPRRRPAPTPVPPEPKPEPPPGGTTRWSWRPSSWRRRQPHANRRAPQTTAAKK